MVIAVFTISSGIINAQLNVKKLKTKAKSAVGAQETKEDAPVQM